MLPVISLDSALLKDGTYYSQVFLKECNYTENKVVRDINDNFSDFSCLVLCFQKYRTLFLKQECTEKQLAVFLKQSLQYTTLCLQKTKQ